MIVNNIKELRKLINEQREKGIKISTINGTFDLLHKGHLDALSYSVENSEKLFILVNSDRSVNLYKGPNRPIENENLRVNNLEKHYPNSYIYIFDELNPLNTLKEIEPDIHFVGPDWGLKKTLEQDLIESIGGKIYYIKKNFEISTTKILEKKGDIKTNKRGIFLDRDGTIIVDKKYLTNINEIEFFPETIKVLTKLMEEGFLLFIISNQSMVSRKMASEQDAIAINDEIVRLLNSMGVEIQESYLDFSHPDNPSKKRKPNTEFLEKASSKYKLALKDSWVIGDKPSDVIFGKRGNTKTIQINGLYELSEFSEFIVNDLEEAYQIILHD